MITGTVLAAALVCWLGLIVAGWDGLVWVGCACLATLATALAVGTGDPNRRAGGAEDEGTPPANRFPHYDEVAMRLRWGLQDGRYFTNALAPRLEQLSRELIAYRRGHVVDEDELRTALGTPVYQLICDRNPAPERDDTPTWSDIEQTLAVLEGL